MTKQTKEKADPRRIGPKFARNVIPENFQIRRPASPMAELLDEAKRSDPTESAESPVKSTPVDSTPVKSTPVHLTPVDSTPVEMPGVKAETTPVPTAKQLPALPDFLDRIMPRFPPARQAILLRLYRWSEGAEREIIVSTPRLAAKTNMDEKACRMHLHALITEGYLVRSMDGEQIAKFGGSDRTARGLLLKISARALSELLD